MNIDKPSFAKSVVPVGASAKTDKEAEEAAYRAQTFITSYYRTFHRKAKGLVKFYLENARISWNGIGLTRSTFETQIAEKMSGSTFTVLSTDCHPLFAADANRGIIVVINGTISNKNKTKQLFSQTFILAKISEKSSEYFIQDDCFRYV
ncbi:hypothetical protein BB561_005328 [Smittium simulii]|uniref:NTF2-related export protein n=1 Tax=Smittium simulii TaxID=133385 RepID=A0A2T9YAW4_9FUNG|nr:hypothetical protein BB561_005328 [Smittium simulii]